MNRANDKHFFELWDLAQSIEEQYRCAKPKEQLEIIAMEEQIFDEGGFYADYSYQEAIAAYKESREKFDAI